MVDMPDHPDVAAARHFAEEHIEDFISFALAGDPEILSNFVKEHNWLYKSWTNQGGKYEFVRD